MTRDEIIKLASQAIDDTRSEVDLPIPFVMRFAMLVAAAEREACATECSDEAKYWSYPSHGNAAATMCAMRIRARNQPPKDGD